MKKSFFTLLILGLLAGCSNTVFYHQSVGELTYSNGESKQAILYWHSIKGKQLFWKTDGTDSDAALRVCNLLPTALVPDPENNNQLVIFADNNDMQVAEISTTGTLTPLPSPTRAISGKSVCGTLYSNKQPATIESLLAAKSLKISFLCKNTFRPDRYPQASTFIFSEVNTKQVEDQLNPDACNPETF